MATSDVPTDHLETVEYWRDLYVTAVEVGQEKITAIRDLHAKRTRDHNGFTEVWCRECNQDWPCPTLKALEIQPVGGTHEGS